jgi:hypothetical protein
MSKVALFFGAVCLLGGISYLQFRDPNPIKIDKDRVVQEGDVWAMCEPTSPDGSSGFKLLWPTKDCKSEDNPIMAGAPRHMTHAKSIDGSAMYLLLWYDRPTVSNDPYREVLLPGQDGSQNGLKGATVIATRQFKIGNMPCLDYTLRMGRNHVSRDRACLFEGKRFITVGTFQTIDDASRDHVNRYIESLTKL